MRRSSTQERAAVFILMKKATNMQPIYVQKSQGPAASKPRARLRGDLHAVPQALVANARTAKVAVK